MPLRPPSNPWRYSAKRFDAQLGLYSFGKRFYAPNLGQWITTDPAGLIDGTNLYMYLHNDPLGHFDLSGEFAFALFGLSWGASGCAATAVFSNPVGWAIGGAIVTAIAVNWATNRWIDSRQISPSTGSAINTIVGGLAGSMIHSIDYCDTGSSVISSAPANKKKESEKRSSDEPGAPPYR